MNEEKVKFVLSLTVRRENEEHGHVYYKQDGQRFGYNCTIKLNVETHYMFTLTLRPSLQIDSASIKGSTVTLLRQQEPTNDNGCIYTFDWFTSGVCMTKKNLREELPLVLMIRNIGTLTVMLQVKFYKAGDQNHSTWGNALHHIEFECETKPHHTFVDILKEVYR